MESISAFRTNSIVQRIYTTAYRAGIQGSLLHHKPGKTISADIQTVGNQTGFITLVIALFKIFNQGAGKPRTGKAIGDSLFMNTIFDFALTAMLRLSRFITCQTSQTGLFGFLRKAMLIAHHTIHTARRKHGFFHHFRHFHIVLLSPMPFVQSQG